MKKGKPPPEKKIGIHFVIDAPLWRRLRKIKSEYGASLSGVVNNLLDQYATRMEGHIKARWKDRKRPKGDGK